MGNWYRVVDPLNPLYGCDVSGDRAAWDDETDETLMISVKKMRRVDVFVGDRPFQLIAKEGESLGLWIDVKHLEDSPLQDDVVELDTTRPYGLCLDEAEMTRRDGVTLRIARYENAVQIAIEDADDCLMATRTLGDAERKVENHLINLWTDGADLDDLVTALKLAGDRN